MIYGDKYQMTKKIYLEGTWQHTSNSLTIKNPFDDSLVDSVYTADREVLERAAQFAVKIFSKTKSLATHVRTTALYQISEALNQCLDDLANIICRESGKPIKDAINEVRRSCSVFRLAAEVLDNFHGEVIPLDVTAMAENRYGLVNRFPKGPILGISPFNFPLNLVSHKVAPAIATGNPIVVKPASKTPLTALKLAEIIDSTSLPKGMLQVVPCKHDVADEIIEDDRFKLLSFTGSHNVGWSLKNRAGKKNVILELGGDAAVYVHHDADLSYAVERCILGSFHYAGQVCISVQRIFLHSKIYDQFLATLVTKAKNITSGDPLDHGTELGPVIDEENRQRIIKWLEQAKGQGAKVHCGGDRQGSIINPTIVTGVSENCHLGNQEVFAPIVMVYSVSSAKEAMDQINSSKYGLQAGVFTNNHSLVQYAYQTLDVGGVIINDIPTFRVDNMPYGGVKDSGFGREGIRYAMESMTEPKLMVVNQTISNLD